MNPADRFETDVIPGLAGELKITFLGHGSLYLEAAGKVIHLDPFGEVADYSLLPDADLVLITHEHFDHLDQNALAAIRKADTVVAANPAAGQQVNGSVILRNGDRQVLCGFPVEAVPAYNLVHLRENGQPFHPKGVGNGYILTLAGLRVYIGGDTENTPEMKALKAIDIAFLPMNLPYTMTPEMVADAARAFKPGILYPYHFGETEVGQLTALLAGQPETDVRIRHMP